MQQIQLIFQIAVIIISIVAHELSHGYTAYFLGDRTAKYAGRLTINPIKHMELFGSVIVPILSVALGGIVFGWAKPVPYNPYNLRVAKYGEVLVAIAGPIANFVIALVFALYIRFAGIDINSPLGQISSLIVLVNLTLTFFNLMPLPPLDGSKILWGIMPYKWGALKATLERNMIAFMLIVILFVSFILDPLVISMFKIMTGHQLN